MERILVNAENVLDCSELLHDAVCEKWTFEYELKTLMMSIRCEGGKPAYKNVVFEGVYAHNMVSCDFWGPSPYLYGIELMGAKASGLYKQIMDGARNAHEENSFKSKMSELYEVRVQFTSGDVLSVLCQRVRIDA